MQTKRSNSEAVEMPVSSSPSSSSSSTLRTDNSRPEEKKEVVVSIPQTVSSSSSVGAQSSSSSLASDRDAWFGGGTYGFGKSMLLGLGQIPTLNNLRTIDKKGDLVPLFPDSVQQGLGLTGDTMSAAYLVVKDKSVVKDIEDRIKKIEAEEREFSGFELSSCQPVKIEKFLAQPPRKPYWEDSKIDFIEVKKSTASMATASVGVNSVTLAAKFLDVCCGWCQGYGAVAAAFVLAIGHFITAARLRTQAVDVETAQENFYAREKQFLRSKLRYYQQLPTVNDVDAMVQRLVILRDIYAEEQKNLMDVQQQFEAEEKSLSGYKEQKGKKLKHLNNSLDKLKQVVVSQPSDSDKKKQDLARDIELFKKALNSSTETDAVTGLDLLYNKIQSFQFFSTEAQENITIELRGFSQHYMQFKNLQGELKDSYEKTTELNKTVAKKENLVLLYGTEIEGIEKILLEVNQSVQNWQSKVATQTKHSLSATQSSVGNNAGFQQSSSSVSYLSMSSAVATFPSSSSSLTKSYIGSSSSFFQSGEESSSSANSAPSLTKSCVEKVASSSLFSTQAALTSQTASTASVSAMSVAVATTTARNTSNDQAKSVTIS